VFITYKSILLVQAYDYGLVGHFNVVLQVKLFWWRNQV